MIKTDKKMSSYEYEFNDGIVRENVDLPYYNDSQIIDYIVDNNLVRDIYSTKDKEYTTDYVFDEKGLLKSKTYYLNGNKERFIEANYSYY
jgi:hypothetical protein